jgi:hypothetical protein
MFYSKLELPKNVVSEVGSHLVEQFLVVVSDEQFDRTYQQFMRGHSLEMAQHPIANFVLQKLISQSRTKEQVVFSIQLSVHVYCVGSQRVCDSDAGKVMTRVEYSSVFASVDICIAAVEVLR